MTTFYRNKIELKSVYQGWHDAVESKDFPDTLYQAQVWSDHEVYKSNLVIRMELTIFKIVHQETESFDGILCYSLVIINGSIFIRSSAFPSIKIFPMQNYTRLNQPRFTLKIIMLIIIVICGDINQSLHLIRRRSYQGCQWDSSHNIVNFEKKILFWTERNIFQTILYIIKKKKSDRVKCSEYGRFKAILKELYSYNIRDFRAICDIILSA
jgi:hypothetical protein